VVKFIGESTCETKISVPISNHSLPEIIGMESIHIYDPVPANEKETQVGREWIDSVNEGNPHFSPFSNVKGRTTLETLYASILMKHGTKRVHMSNQSVNFSFDDSCVSEKITSRTKSENLFD
jgi:hypothetical protein